MKSVEVRDGTKLACFEAGTGTPIIFIHGTLGDSSMWTEFVREFGKNYRAIAYSRRYNYPNKHALQPNHSTAVEAKDLAAFIKKLGLPKSHIVGYSDGGYTALHLAVDHPNLVRTLVLAEPPLVPWLQDIPGDRAEEGKRLFKDSLTQFMIPARKALAKGDDISAVEIFIDQVIAKGAFQRLAPQARDVIERNIPEFVAEVKSDNMFAPLTRQEVRGVTAPTLRVSGQNSTSMLRLVDEELDRVLPSETSERVVIPNATHGGQHLCVVDHALGLFLQPLDIIPSHPNVISSEGGQQSQTKSQHLIGSIHFLPPDLETRKVFAWR